MKILVAGDVSFDGGKPSQTCLSELSYIGRDYTIFSLLGGSIKSEHMTHLVDAEVSHVFGGSIDQDTQDKLSTFDVITNSKKTPVIIDQERGILSCVVGEDDLPKVESLREEHPDLLFICFIIWEKDFSLLPEEQRAFARELIDRKVDLVIGSGAKLLPFVFYRGKPICYSLGNIYSPEYEIGYVSVLEFNDKNRLTSFNHCPIICTQEKTKVLKKNVSGEVGKEALKVAKSCLGQGESEEETNRGPFINQIGAIPGKAWCSQFISYCLIEAYKNMGLEVPFERQQRAKKLQQELINKGVGYTVLHPSAGDIIFWDRREEGGEAGHVGIIESFDGDKIVVIEGNHPPSPGSKVAKFTYSLKNLVTYSGWDYTDRDFHLYECFVRVVR